MLSEAEVSDHKVSKKTQHTHKVKENLQKKRSSGDPIKNFTQKFFDPYAPSLESLKDFPIQKNYSLFINGEFKPAVEKKTFTSINPADETIVSTFSYAGKKDVDLAVNSAQKAFEGTWSKISGAERGKYLFRIARIIQERSKELALLESFDGGKPIKEARDVDIPLCAAHFFYYAGWADKLQYLYPGKAAKPLGVCAQIIPWNFPLLMAAWKLAPALAAGNTCVLKPAETTPLTSLILAEICQEAGLPAGVVNIITGDGVTGAHLVNHPKVRKVAFTGSTEVGKLISQSLSKTKKSLTLELGGKSANIVFSDAALDQALEGVVQGIYFNQGQVCCAGSRLLLEEPIAKDFIEKLKLRMQSLKVGLPLDKNTDIGAINSSNQLHKIQHLVDIGKKDGHPYYETDNALPEKGYFHPPCFFTGTSAVNFLDQVEIFGPVLSISTFRTPQEAIKKANNTPYGLAAGIWSEKGSKVHQVASALKAGVVWANSYNKFDPCSPFGGVKESGIGREGGLQGLLPYLELNS